MVGGCSLGNLRRARRWPGPAAATASPGGTTGATLPQAHFSVQVPAPSAHDTFTEFRDYSTLLPITLENYLFSTANEHSEYGNIHGIF
ncbi:hypothetical protein [Humidesulfovibrio idahonensis]